MTGKLTIRNTGGKLRSIRVIVETDTGLFEAGMPLQGQQLTEVTQIGFVLMTSRETGNIDDVRKRVEESLQTGRIGGKREGHYGKR